MSMTADPSTNNHSPKSPLNSGDGRRRNLPSPWAQVVRGGGGGGDVAEPETVSVVPLPPRSLSSPSHEQAPFSDCSNGVNEMPAAAEAVVAVDAAADTQVLDGSDSSNGNVARSKKPAWKKPVNGVVVEGSGSPVMGADSWPALTKLTRPVPKSTGESSSSPSPSSNPIPDGSVFVSQGPVISHPPQKQAKTNANASTSANANSTPNHHHRQRQIRRGGGNGGGSTGFTRPLPPPPFPLYDMPYGNLVPAVLDSPVREPPFNGNNWVARPIASVGSQPHGANDHSSHRSRRGNFGPRPRGGGDGFYVNGYGGRRDQDRELYAPRGSSTRDVHMPHQMAPPPPPPRAYIGHPLPASPYIGPQPMRPFGNPMGYDLSSSPYLYVPALHPESFRGAPVFPHAPPPAVYFPVMDPLPGLVINQIEYYFSDANLVKDNYLRSHMDDDGWVPITLIASFPRVHTLTDDVQLILGYLRDSTAVEVQGDKVRRRHEWRKWIRTSDRFPIDSASQSPRGATDDLLANSFQELGFDEVTNQMNNPGVADAHSVELTGQSELANGEVHAEACSSHT